MASSIHWKPLIFWVDNEEGPLLDHEDEVAKAFIIASRELSISEVEVDFVPFRTGRELLERIRSDSRGELVELIGCDFSLDSSDVENGFEAVREIQNLRYPTDIVVYGAPDNELKDMEKDIPGWYGSVTVCRDGDKVRDTILSSARKSLVKWLDKEYLRGLIISRTTDVEVKLDELLMGFYEIKDELKGVFGTDILQADLLGFGKKITIVQKMVKKIPDNSFGVTKNWKTEFNEDIAALSKLRNEAAHGIAGMEYGEFYLINRGEKKIIDKKELSRHLYRAFQAYSKLEELFKNLDKITGFVLSQK